VANILLSLNRKNTLDNSCNDKEDNNSEGENKGDKNDQFHANVNMSARELGKGNVCLTEECCVDGCEGQLEENSKAIININNHECNVITDTEDDSGIIFWLESNDVKVSLRVFGSYMKFNKECYHKRYKSSEVNTYLTAQLFGAPAAGQKWHRLKSMNITGRYEKKNVEGEQLSILSRIRNEIQENWDNTYMNAKNDPGSWFQGKVVSKKKTRKIQHEHFPKVPHVQQLIKIFENLDNDIMLSQTVLLCTISNDCMAPY
jgi:hypothetical protein